MFVFPFFFIKIIQKLKMDISLYELVFQRFRFVIATKNIPKNIPKVTNIPPF